MKKLLAIVLAAMMILAFAACEKPANPEPAAPTEAPQENPRTRRYGSAE